MTYGRLDHNDLGLSENLAENHGKPLNPLVDDGNLPYEIAIEHGYPPVSDRSIWIFGAYSLNASIISQSELGEAWFRCRVSMEMISEEEGYFSVSVVARPLI